MATLFEIRAINIKGARKHWQHIKEALIVNVHTLTDEEKAEAVKVYKDYCQRFSITLTSI